MNCYFKTNRMTIICPKPELTIRTTSGGHICIDFLYFSNIPKNNTNYYLNYLMNNGIERITIDFKDTGFIFNRILALLQYHLDSYVPNLIKDYNINQQKYNFFIDSYFVKNLKSYRNDECIDQNIDLFNDDFADNCIIDCFNFETNRTLNCLPTNRIDSWIRVERDFNYFGYKLCPYFHNITLNSSQNIMIKCINNCKFGCNQQYLNVRKYEINGKNDRKTTINFFPKYIINFDFKETVKMDFNDLIYECGGIIGMWLGWSFISISSVIENIKIFISYIYKIIEILILIFKKIFDCFKIFFKLIFNGIIFIISRLKYRCNLIIQWVIRKKRERKLARVGTELKVYNSGHSDYNRPIKIY